MPPTGYLTWQGIRQGLQHLSTQYSEICELIELPEHSAAGNRKIHAVRIGHDTEDGDSRRGVLLLGGTHARELINPDLLISFGLRLCEAYTNGTGLTYGSRSYGAGTIELLVDHLDVFLLPLVNPDGRDHVQKNNGDPMWRKNRTTLSGTSCRGVDLNRNYDFLWSETIGVTSAAPCDIVYRGPAVFSEPETRNVRWMLDTYADIACLVDVHSAGEMLLYPWGDDDNQSATPSQNFQNPAFDGQRGTLGDAYGEYITAADQHRHASVATRVRDAIAAVRGRTYEVKEASGLYPTSGTTKDYAFSRHLVDGSNRKILAYTFETATEFQPAYSEALQVMDEVQSGLVQLLIDCMCVVEATARGSTAFARLDRLRAFRDLELLRFARGQEAIEALEHHSFELLVALGRSRALRSRARTVLEQVAGLLPEEGIRGVRVPDDLVDQVQQLIDEVGRRASPDLQRTLQDVKEQVSSFRGRTVAQGLKDVRRRRSDSSGR